MKAVTREPWPHGALSAWRVLWAREAARGQSGLALSKQNQALPDADAGRVLCVYVGKSQAMSKEDSGRVCVQCRCGICIDVFSVGVRFASVSDLSLCLGWHPCVYTFVGSQPGKSVNVCSDVAVAVSQLM